MLFLLFYFLLCAILLFQGLHLSAETRTPLGTLPPEVTQDPQTSRGLGGLLMAYAGLAALLGLGGFASGALAAARPALFLIGLVLLALFGLWVILLGRKPEYMGKPAPVEDHGHH